MNRRNGFAARFAISITSLSSGMRSPSAGAQIGMRARVIAGRIGAADVEAAQFGKRQILDARRGLRQPFAVAPRQISGLRR